MVHRVAVTGIVGTPVQWVAAASELPAVVMEVTIPVVEAASLAAEGSLEVVEGFLAAAVAVDSRTAVAAFRVAVRVEHSVAARQRRQVPPPRAERAVLVVRQQRLQPNRCEVVQPPSDLETWLAVAIPSDPVWETQAAA
jgi:hypothetical protein